MGSTVYLNEHFTPNNQSSYYQNQMTNYLEKQEENNQLILKKLEKQQAMMNKQHFDLLYCMSNWNKEYDELHAELNKIKACVQQNSHFTKENQQILLEIIDKIEEIDETSKQNKLDFTSNHQFIRTKINKMQDQFQLMDQNQKNDFENILSSLKTTESNLLEKQDDLVANMLTELNQIHEKLNGKLGEIQDSIVHSILTDLEKINTKLTNYLQERSRQSMCDFFKGLNPGTKVNSIIVSGLEVQLASFIHYKQATKQVNFIKNDGNLFIANCADIEAVELKTKDA